MNKSDILREFQQVNNGNGQKDNSNTTIDLSKVKPQDTNKVVSVVQQNNNLQKQIGDLKKSQNTPGIQNEVEGDDKEIFYKEMLDNLLDARYGLTYFAQKEGVPCYQTMSPEDKQRMESKYAAFGYTTVLSKIQKNELYNAYIFLQNILQNKNENLVNQKLFSIIAENEAPRISKGDLIEYVNSKKA